MKAKVSATGGGANAAAVNVDDGSESKNRRNRRAGPDLTAPLTKAMGHLTNVCATLATTGNSSTDDDYMTTVAAFATMQKGRTPMEFKDFDQPEGKGGKICILS